MEPRGRGLVKKRRRLVDLLGQWPMTDANFVQIRPFIVDFRRRLLGLSETVSLDRLKSTLIELGAGENKREGTPLPYIKNIAKNQDNVDVWEIGYVYGMLHPLDNKRFFQLFPFVLTLANALRCHPAVALAFIMCDFMPYRPDVLIPALIRDGRRLSIEVPTPNVSPHVVYEVYRRARRDMVEEGQAVNGKRIRSRAPTQRSHLLRIFVLQTRSLPWQQRWEGWNAKYPRMRYQSVNSMTVAYSKLKSLDGG
jgi:hypothetical protein